MRMRGTRIPGLGFLGIGCIPIILLPTSWIYGPVRGILSARIRFPYIRASRFPQTATQPPAVAPESHAVFRIVLYGHLLHDKSGA